MRSRGLINDNLIAIIRNCNKSDDMAQTDLYAQIDHCKGPSLAVSQYVTFL